ncbi:type VI secretion system Vgr family protein [Burkholderia sp. IDO3]|uniref:Rhs element Vgr protein n=2 Tax=Burkholderia anthina TaxID=179879 RepID=A0A6P2GCY7_9BURK|nr:type VI secretion system Vgr family protein [Burkholderia sp. IDO3]AXK61702.1 type VI secretion system tip protein VgrG [Burkholderia sp. IDO3]MBM2769003.1 type VI secretion system tip protein VgrG [Burkholderia anthina]PCD63051.1 type VI secretion system tip protein VgrG [Burkholderia sp. IDO3]VVU51475.1 Rhs element Vgr protein [Burkholderia anthina]
MARERDTQRALAQWITGRQSYFLEVPGAPAAQDLSIMSFVLDERLGEPYRIAVTLTSAVPLARTDYLNRPATFTIEPPGANGATDAVRRFAGCITAFGQIRKTRDFVSYRIVVEPFVARLRLVEATRVHQQQSAPEIIESILRRHEFRTHQFSFKLRHAYPRLAFRMQYRMSDWDYIRLLMEQTGLFCFFRAGQHGDELHFGDDVDAYTYRPQIVIPYREASGLESGHEAVLSLESSSETIPRSIKVADYNADNAQGRFDAEANIARDDPTTWGASYVYGTHHLDGDEARRAAQLRHEAALAWQVTYSGKSSVVDFAPGLVAKLDEQPVDAPHGIVIVSVRHAGGCDASYINTFDAIPCGRPFRLKLDERRWPTIAGTLSARVTAPDASPYAHLTSDGCYTVRFDFDFDAWPAGGECVPLRLAKPFAGSHQTGFHFPLLADTEVAVAFAGGDPNRPYIAHAQHHGQAVDLVTSRDAFNTRNVIRTRANNKLRFEDWKGHEGIKLSTDYGGKTQINLGHLVDARKAARGDGFEVRTDERGALRAGKGLFLSADAQSNAGGHAFDMTVARQQLEAAQSRMRSLTDAVAKARATVAACEAQQALLESQVRDLEAAVLLASAPHGVAVTSGEHMQLAAGGHLFTTTGGNADAAIGGNYTVAAGNAVSLFANTQGMKLYAGAGKVDVQAQADALELTALKGVTIASTSDAVTLNAHKALVLMCGGAYIKLEGGMVEIGSAAEIRLNGLLRVGPPSTRRQALPLMPEQEKTGMQLWHAYPNGEPVRHAPYRVTFADGSWRDGRLDADGRGTVANVPRGGGAVEYFEEGHDLLDRTRKWDEPKGAPQFVAPGEAAVAPAVPSLVGATLAAAMTGTGAAKRALESAASIEATAARVASSVAQGDVAAFASSGAGPLAHSVADGTAATVPDVAPDLRKSIVSR